jgi:hypothetical protein
MHSSRSSASSSSSSSTPSFRHVDLTTPVPRKRQAAAANPPADVDDDIDMDNPISSNPASALSTYDFNSDPSRFTLVMKKALNAIPNLLRSVDSIQARITKMNSQKLSTLKSLKTPASSKFQKDLPEDVKAASVALDDEVASKRFELLLNALNSSLTDTNSKIESAKTDARTSASTLSSRLPARCTRPSQTAIDNFILDFVAKAAATVVANHLLSEKKAAAARQAPLVVPDEQVALKSLIQKEIKQALKSKDSKPKPKPKSKNDKGRAGKPAAAQAQKSQGKQQQQQKKKNQKQNTNKVSPSKAASGQGKSRAKSRQPSKKGPTQSSKRN